MSSNSLYKVVNSYLVAIIIIHLWAGYKKMMYSIIIEFHVLPWGKIFRNGIMLKLNKNRINNTKER